MFFLYNRDIDIEKLEINLGLLKPLWQLYNTMTKQESEPTVILPPVSRALTELFLQVENLAIVSTFVLLILTALCNDEPTCFVCFEFYSDFNVLAHIIPTSIPECLTSSFQCLHK